VLAFALTFLRDIQSHRFLILECIQSSTFVCISLILLGTIKTRLVSFLFSRQFKTVPWRTQHCHKMAWDGNLGIETLFVSPCWWYNGMIPLWPTCTTWYNSTGWTLGNESVLVVWWDDPTCTRWYNDTGWTLGIEPLLEVWWDNPTCTRRYNGMGWTLGIESLLVVWWDDPNMSHLY